MEIVAVVDTDLLLSATDTAEIVTVPPAGGKAGAV